jgi:hypothetical protein
MTSGSITISTSFVAQVSEGMYRQFPICSHGSDVVFRLAAAMLGHLRLSLEETDGRMTSLLNHPRPGLFTHSSIKRRLENSRLLHTDLHDKLEPESLKPSIRMCDSPRDVCRGNASQFLSVPGMCQT